jgi:hypothetical protein
VLTPINFFMPTVLLTAVLEQLASRVAKATLALQEVVVLLAILVAKVMLVLQGQKVQ